MARLKNGLFFVARYMSSLNYASIAHLIPASAGKIVIAYSGGVDSHVLLHICASQVKIRSRILAVYVNHGLQAVADDWAQHCRQQADALEVRYLCLNVNAKAANGESPEAAARNARYQALQSVIDRGDCLLLAQHREDQLETMLLQLFRGAGVQGLAAMPVSIPFAGGTLVRPLLTVAQADILTYAQQHGLKWIEDPSNQSSDFDRNYLRNQIVPLLKQRWPSVDKTVARSAQHCGAASALLDDWGQRFLGCIINPTNKSLDIEQLKQCTELQSNWLLRQWFKILGLKPPSQALLQTIKQQLLTAHGNANPEIRTQAHLLRKYRQQLFCLPERQCLALQTSHDWPSTMPAISLPNNYVLSRIPASSGLAQKLWHHAKISLQPRRGGEKIKLPGRDGQHCLKKLFQEAGIPPWERETRPLVYIDDRLAAVAGLWIAEWAWADVPDGCYRLTWQLSEIV